MKNISPAQLLAVSLNLLIIAIAVLIVSHIEVIPPPPVEPADSILVQPSPAWEAFPTRIPSPTPTSAATAPLHTIRNALQRGDAEAAELAWDTAMLITPEEHPERGIILREGARIALAERHFDAAEARIWEAIRIRGQDAEAWSLLGTILARRGDNRVAEQALAVAATLDPDIALDLFTDRWLAARRTGHSDIMMALAQFYSSRNPESTLAFYYRNAALLAYGDPISTIDQLTAVLDTAAPGDESAMSNAVLWYTLGEAYLAHHAYTQTLTALDVAGSLFGQGDNSLYLASDDPIRDLNLLRARAFLGINTPARCADAEPLLQRWNAPADVITQSIVCQTPTPTMTPWIPSQQPTLTPTPPAP